MLLPRWKINCTAASWSCACLPEEGCLIDACMHVMCLVNRSRNSLIGHLGQYVNGITLRQGLGQDRMSCYYAGFVEVLWELGQRMAWRSDIYSHIHQSILDNTCICILEQGSMWTRIVYVFFRRGRAWYVPFLIRAWHNWKITKACLANTELVAKLLDPIFFWNEDLGMRLNSTNVVWYSIGIPPTLSQTICVIVCRQSTYSFDAVYINTHQIRTTYGFQTFQQVRVRMGHTLTIPYPFLRQRSVVTPTIVHE